MPERLDQIEAQLTSANSEDRLSALAHVTADDIGPLIPLILHLLNVPDDAIRSAAAGAVIRILDGLYRAAGTQLLLHLNDGSALVRTSIIEGLGSLRYQAAADALANCLRDLDPLVRATAAEALGDLNQPLVRLDLEAALLDEDESVRAFAANSLGLLADSDSLRAVERRLQYESSPRVRAELLGARCRLESETDLDGILQILATPDRAIAIAVVNVIEDLARRRTPKAIERKRIEVKRSLQAVADRHPLLGGQVAETIERIDRLRGGASRDEDGSPSSVDA